jgi:hypothetical protein
MRAQPLARVCMHIERRGAFGVLEMKEKKKEEARRAARG